MTIDLSPEIDPTVGGVLEDRVSPRAAVENVDIRHTQGEFGGGWIGGIYLHNALHVTLNRCRCSLRYATGFEIMHGSDSIPRLTQFHEKHDGGHMSQKCLKHSVVNLIQPCQAVSAKKCMLHRAAESWSSYVLCMGIAETKNCCLPCLQIQ